MARYMLGLVTTKATLFAQNFRVPLGRLGVIRPQLLQPLSHEELMKIRWTTLSHCILPVCVCALIILLGTITCQAATYYVATTGSDSNPGTSDRPWRHPMKCVRSPIKAGDTCIVRSGTYTDTDRNGTTVYTSSLSASGTSSQPITIKSEKPLGAVIVVPSSVSGTNSAINIHRPYYIIEGFDINGGTNAASHVGIIFKSTATGGVARSNAIHHIARSVCTNTGMNSGILIQGTSNVRIEENRIYTIGRRRNGESGCSTSIYQHDHGVYAYGANITIRRNVIYDTNRGYPIHIYGGTTTNLYIYHNTLSGKSPTGLPQGQIRLASTINGAYVRNNASHNASVAMANVWSLSASNVNISHNQSTSAMNVHSTKPSGVTFSNNLEKVSNLGFINASGNDFRLTSSSIAINRGTSSGVPLVPDGVPDVAAYEYSQQNNIASPLTPTGLSAQ